MPKRKPTLEVRVDQIEAHVVELQEQFVELGATPEELAAVRGDIEELRAAIHARGAIPNPEPSLSSKARTQRAQNAAKARAAKDVGKGSGRVSSKAVQQKLRRDLGAPQKKKRRRSSS